MKRILFLMLALLLITVVAVSCDSKTPASETGGTDTVATVAPETEISTKAPAETPTEAVTEVATEVATEAPTEELTEAPTEASSESGEEEITLPSEDGEVETEWTDPEGVPYVSIVNPVISNGTNTPIKGYNVSGEFNFERGDAWSTTDNNMFIVTNDRLPKGKLTATFVAPEQYVNDNGIVFGMMEDEYEQYYFWEDGPTYYFLFVSDDATLYLAKASSNGNPWTELHISEPIPNYKHGDVVTISVEFDGEGFIDCYVNGEWMISYYDEEWTGGSRYGIRCEVPDVCYTDIVADPNFVYEE